MKLSRTRIRSTIVEALEDSDAIEHLEASMLAAFERGERDIRIDDLGLDSLARIDLLVAIELEYQIVISPSVFTEFRTLSDIVVHVESSSETGAQTTEDSRATPSAPESGTEEAPPRIPRLFMRAFPHCQTVAEMTLLLGRLTARMSPLEAADFCAWHRKGLLIPASAPAKFETGLADWISEFERRMQASGKSEPEPFTGRRISPAALHYVGPGERQEKTLLVCFSVMGHRTLSIPHAVFLQHVDARKYDVLFLADLWGTAFRSGAPLMGNDVLDVVRWISKSELLQGYVLMRTFGCSGGVYPALLTGRLLGAEVIVGLNGRLPKGRLLGKLGRMYFNCWRTSLWKRRARALLVYAATERKDAKFARRLSRLTGASQLAMEMPQRELSHNVIQPLLKHGELKFFLEQTLFSSGETRLFAKDRAPRRVVFPIE